MYWLRRSGGMSLLVTPNTARSMAWSVWWAPVTPLVKLSRVLNGVTARPQSSS
ncbi:hypothetical protein FQZ97_1261510 [compost metagenome]